jgi:hypothetical protein
MSGRNKMTKPRSQFHTHTLEREREREREGDEQETIEDRNGIMRTTFRNVKTSRIKKHVGKTFKKKEL